MDAKQVRTRAEGSHVSEGAIEACLPSLLSRVPVEAFLERSNLRTFLKGLLETSENQFDSRTGLFTITSSLGQADLNSVRKLFAREGIYLDQKSPQTLSVSDNAQLERLRYLNLLSARDLNKIVQVLKYTVKQSAPDERHYDQVMTMYKSGEFADEKHLYYAWNRKFPDATLTLEEIKSWVKGINLPPEVAKRAKIFDLPSITKSAEITQAFELLVRRRSDANPLTYACKLATEMHGSLEFAALQSDIKAARLTEIVRGGVAPDQNEYASLLSSAGVAVSPGVMHIWSSSHLRVVPQNDKQVLALLNENDRLLAKNYIGSLKVTAASAAERGEDVGKAVRQKMKEIRDRVSRMVK